MAASASPSTPQPNGQGAKSSSKPGKPTNVVILRLSPSALGRFSPDQSSRQPSVAKAAPSTPQAAESVAPEIETESNATPAPNDASDAASTANGLKRKGIPGPKPGAGAKRATPAAADANGIPKQRGKPGPKKRIKLDGETNGTPAAGTTTAPSNPKLGPKANQGAINARLRALDRSRKPCRRWQKNGFQLKSFTGHTWAMPSWRTFKVNEVQVDPIDENATPGTSDAKPEEASSGMASEKSNSGVGDSSAPAVPTDLASSPAPAAPVGTAAPA